MMNSTLERAGTAYRDGYRDGEAGRPKRSRPEWPQGGKPFEAHDYDEGYKAGANDQHWRAVYDGRACDIKTKRCGL